MPAFIRKVLPVGFSLLILSATFTHETRRPPPRGAPARAFGADAGLGFEENRGQFDGVARFVARGEGFTLSLQPGGAMMRLRGEASDKPPVELRMALVDGQAGTFLRGREALPGRSHYLRGSDPAGWVTDVSTYAKVEYEQVYPGVDLQFYGDGKQLEYDFVVAPGADPAQIRLSFEGIERAEIDAAGDLLLETGSDAVRQRRPRLHQDIRGQRREVAGGFSLRGPREVGFSVGPYDARQPLVIDPVVEYSTYQSGGRGFSGIQDVAVDAQGNAYVVGYFPWDSDRGLPDMFVTKYNPAGVRLFTSRIGGTFSDEAKGVAVDALGNIYLTGSTNSTAACRSFPVTSDAFQPDNASPRGCLGGFDAFVIELDPTGRTLLYSSFLGGAGDDWGADIEVDDRGRIYVAGKTTSTNSPTANAWQAVPGGGTDAFVAAFDPGGTALVFSTYLGGGGDESVARLAVSPKRETLVAGRTSSPDFPARRNSLQSAFGGGSSDAFVAVLTPGGGLKHATYLGGSGREDAFGIATDGDGFVYVTGSTTSSDFPTAAPLQAGLSLPPEADAFLAKIDARLTNLAYSTYLDIGRNASCASSWPSTPPCGGVAVSSGGDAYLPANGVFVLKVNAAGTARQTFHGFGGHGIGLSSSPIGTEVFVAGRTASSLFPTIDAASPIHRWIESELGWLTKLTDAPNPPAAFEETDPRISYTGTWETDSSPEDSGGAAVRSSETGAKATITFTGTGIQVIGRRDPSSGFVRITQNFNFDFPSALLDTYASQAEARSLLLSSSGLPRRTYTLTLEVTGTKNSRSGGTSVSIDGINVLDTPAP